MEATLFCYTLQLMLAKAGGHTCIRFHAFFQILKPILKPAFVSKSKHADASLFFFSIAAALPRPLLPLLLLCAVPGGLSFLRGVPLKYIKPLQLLQIFQATTLLKVSMTRGGGQRKGRGARQGMTWEGRGAKGREGWGRCRRQER